MENLKISQRHGEAPLDESWRALREAERCLGCFEAPCISSCPTHINVPQFIGRLRTGNLEGAYQTLISANVLPLVCGLVCPVEYICEGACVLTGLTGHPVQIAALQRYVSRQAQQDEVCVTRYRRRVAVIGAGPGGIACAVRLRQYGYPVDLFDEHDQPGGLASFSIPNYRLPDAELTRELERFEKTGFAFHAQTRIDQAKLEEIAAKYDAVYLGIGLSGGRSAGIPGMDLEGVWDALQYLEAVRRADRKEGAAPRLGKRVVVVGGGNVALDAASVAKVNGAEEVIVLYRRTRAEMPAWESEYFDAIHLDVRFEWLTGVSEIVGEGKKVKGVRTFKMALGDLDASGRRSVSPVEGSEDRLNCDHVILSIGQALDFEGLDALGITVGKEGNISIDWQSWQTTRKGIFAGGDAVRGGAYVVQAIADGTQAARSIHQYLSGGESNDR